MIFCEILATFREIWKSICEFMFHIVELDVIHLVIDEIDQIKKCLR